MGSTGLSAAAFLTSPFSARDGVPDLQLTFYAEVSIIRQCPAIGFTAALPLPFLKSAIGQGIRRSMPSNAQISSPKTFLQVKLLYLFSLPLSAFIYFSLSL